MFTADNSSISSAQQTARLNNWNWRVKFFVLALSLIPTFGMFSPASVHAVELSIVVNEVDCHGNDWVELFNLSSKSVDISNWILTDKKFSTTNLAHLYKFPEDTVISGRGRLVVQQTGVGNLQLPFGISCVKGGVVRLGQPLSPTSTNLINEFKVPITPANVSYGRVPDGSANLEFTHATKNKSNKTALPIALGARSKVCEKKRVCLFTLRAIQTTKFQLVKKTVGVSLSAKGKLTISANQVQAKTYQVKLSNAVGARIIQVRVSVK